GLAPLTACEQNRQYSLKDATSAPRTYAEEFKILHGTKADTTDIRIAPTDKSLKPILDSGAVIRLKTPSGSLTPVSILNSPIGIGMEDHFMAYSRLVGLRPPVCLFPTDCGVAPPAKLSLTQLRFAAKPCQYASQGATNPPDPGCIPLFHQGD